MKSRIIAFILSVVIVMGLTTPSFAVGEPVTATPTSSTVKVNGEAVRVQAYNIGGNNYFKLRDLGLHIGFSVTWDGPQQAIYIETAKPYTPDGSETATGTTLSSASVTGTPTTASVYVDGRMILPTSYNIGGNNYFKLRDIAVAVDFGVEWDGENNTVLIDTNVGYTPEDSGSAAENEKEVAGNASGDISDTPITTKLVDGKDASREDFSRQANPAIFNDFYTRGVYNALRQTVLDREKILQGNDSSGFNPYYHYAHTVTTTETWEVLNSVTQRIGVNYRYELKNEPYVKEMYNYPGYLICTISEPDIFAEARAATEEVIRQASLLSTDSEKVKLFNDYICDRLEYDANGSNGINQTFTSTIPVKGSCTVYTYSLQYLCDLVGIPSIVVTGDNHAWNLVYADKKWGHVDVSQNDVSDYNGVMLTPEHFRKDEKPQVTAFAQEVLVPNSTVR